MKELDINVKNLLLGIIPIVGIFYCLKGFKENKFIFKFIAIIEFLYQLQILISIVTCIITILFFGVSSSTTTIN